MSNQQNQTLSHPLRGEPNESQIARWIQTPEVQHDPGR
jgi:hypothetical protein